MGAMWGRLTNHATAGMAFTFLMVWRGNNHHMTRLRRAEPASTLALKAP